jgi:hypothetical protein
MLYRGDACSDLGDPSRLFGMLVWLPPQFLLRSRIKLDSMKSRSSPVSIMASCARPGLLSADPAGHPPAAPLGGGSAIDDMTELRLEYSDRSVMGVRFGSRDAAVRPDFDRWTADDGGPKYPPMADSYASEAAAPSGGSAVFVVWW